MKPLSSLIMCYGKKKNSNVFTDAGEAVSNHIILINSLSSTSVRILQFHMAYQITFKFTYKKASEGAMH